MDRYIVATIKSWNIRNFRKLRDKYPNSEFVLIDKQEELTMEFVESISPKYLFFPHWSWMIPRELFDKYTCVVFHMTDLPFGRGGSPLQNLLVRGIYETKISALKVCAGLDTGPIYFKEPIDISEGGADEILGRVSDIIFEKMIPLFIGEEKIVPKEQTGKVVLFSRRIPSQSEIPGGLSARQLYDYIRMLDGEGYPPAYIKVDNGRIYYTDAVFENGIVTAKARFEEDKTE